jgi:hypothetical protein
MQRDNSGLSISGARELTERELTLIHGGGLFGDVWNTVTGAAQDVGHAIAVAATSTWKVLSSDTALKIYRAIGSVLTKPPPPIN